MFRRSLGVGNNVSKIYIRYREILKLTKFLMTDKFVALEFGSGSSTILLYHHPKVSKLITIEENPEFLPHISVSSKAWEVPSLNTKIAHLADYRSTVFQNTYAFVEMADFIYIDGPSNSQNPTLNLAEPNLELLQHKNLEGKLILIDCRTLTVLELSEKLKVSHILIPSKAVLREYRNSLVGIKRFPHLDKIPISVPEFAKGAVGFHPIRTSIFIPKIRKT